jgi:microcystin-dependent protein
MPDTFTPNLNLTKPEIGSSADTWGNKLNADMDILDGTFASTGTGTVVRRNAVGNADVGPGIDISGPIASSRFISWFSTTSKRWLMGTNNTSESGGNDGSDFVLQRFSDGGASIDVPIAVDRTSGVVTMSQTPQVGVNPIYHAGNLPAALVPIAEPVGTIKIYAGSSDPSAYFMICDGRAISRTTYAALFALVGTTYGIGDGSTTFNIPNTGERIVVGRTTTPNTLIPQYDASIMGARFGEGLHVNTVGEMAVHNHTITDTGHTHTIGAASQFQFQAGGGGIAQSGSLTSGNSQTGIAINNAGGLAGVTQGHNNVQPSIVFSHIIRVQ